MEIYIEFNNMQQELTNHIAFYAHSASRPPAILNFIELSSLLLLLRQDIFDWVASP